MPWYIYFAILIVLIILDSSDQMFTHFKAYDDQKGSFGSLEVSTASFVKCIGNFKGILITKTIEKPEVHSS